MSRSKCFRGQMSLGYGPLLVLSTPTCPNSSDSKSHYKLDSVQTDIRLSAPLIQTTLRRTEELAFATMIVAGITYGRFVVTVINEITNYLGIACLTVRKKDKNGEWQDANPEKHD